MDKSNVAFALLSVILGLYIAAALLLSRVRGARTNKTAHDKTAHHETGHDRAAIPGRN